jgi:predicted ester cyclase
MKVNQENKATVLEYWAALERSGSQTDCAVLNGYVNEDVLWRGPEPIGQLRGPSAFIQEFWSPLLRSFPGLIRQTHVFLGGRSNGRVDGLLDGEMWVGGTGLFTGRFAEDYLGIPASGTEVNIRWGEFCRLRDGRIVELCFLLDLVDLMQQAGFQVLPPSRGADGIYPPPLAGDGVLLEAQDSKDSEYSLQHIRTFIFDGLNKYNQSSLKSMGMADFFHPEVKWYGPGGIGACFNFAEFETLHQKPWLKAFPDRAVQNLDALIAEGSYSGGPGWAGVKATHTGEYLDCPASGKPIDINGLDWWKREGEQYIENWVFVDMIHLFRQFGVDLFERLARQVAQRN